MAAAGQDLRGSVCPKSGPQTTSAPGSYSDTARRTAAYWSARKEARRRPGQVRRRPQHGARSPDGGRSRAGVSPPRRTRRQPQLPAARGGRQSRGAHVLGRPVRSLALEVGRTPRSRCPADPPRESGNYLPTLMGGRYDALLPSSGPRRCVPLRHEPRALEPGSASGPSGFQSSTGAGWSGPWRVPVTGSGAAPSHRTAVATHEGASQYGV